MSTPKQRIEPVLKHWGLFKRDGSTFPNALGYGSSTVEAGLMDGTIGGTGGLIGSISPTYTNWDDEIIKADRIIARMHEDMRSVIAAKWIYQLNFRQMEVIAKVSRSKLHRHHRDAILILDGELR